MNLTMQQLYIMLGIKPNTNIEDIQIIVKNIKTNEVLNTMTMDDLFQELYSVPCDLSLVA